MPYLVQMMDCTFTANHSAGKRGTAINLLGFYYIDIRDSLISDNGVAITKVESLYSPYFKRFNKFISWQPTDEIKDEFYYYQLLLKQEIEDDLSFDLPNPNSALYI